jgi:hypothetical protein
MARPISKNTLRCHFVLEFSCETCDGITLEAGETMRDVLEGLREEESVVSPCPFKGIATNLSFRWREEGKAFRYFMLLAYAMAFSLGTLLGMLE